MGGNEDVDMLASIYAGLAVPENISANDTENKDLNIDDVLKPFQSLDFNIDQKSRLLRFKERIEDSLSCSLPQKPSRRRSVSCKRASSEKISESEKQPRLDDPDQHHS